MAVTQIDKFCRNLEGLLDNMKDIIGDLNMAQLTSLTKGDVDIVKTYAINLDKKFLIESFISSSEPHWDKILNKDDEFFITKSSDIFGEYANYQNFNALKIIFSKNDKGTSLVDVDTREGIREYIFSLIRISIGYIFQSKGGTVEKVNENGINKTKITYRNKNAFPSINIREHADKWKVKLW